MSNFFVRVSRRITGNTIYFQTDINRVPLVTLKDKTGADASDKIAFRWQIIFFFTYTTVSTVIRVARSQVSARNMLSF